MSADERIDFTLSRLDWKARLKTVDVADAAPLQVEVLDELGRWARRNDFALTLVHDPELFRARSALSDAVMSDADHVDALAPADREFAALVESRVTGCRYCAFVHGNDAIALGGDAHAVHAVIDEGLDAELLPRSRAIADFATELAATPTRVTAQTVEGLRAAGVSTGEAIDLVFAVAQFAWANRTMLTLGETVRPDHG